MNTFPENEDIDFEPEDEMGSVGAAKAKMQKLRDELEKIKAERQEYLDGWQRCKADAVNAKKESAVYGERLASRAKEALLEEFIPALDSLDMAFASAAWDGLDAEWKKGMEQVKSQFLDALRRNDVEKFAHIGDMYDPHLHDAIQEVENEGQVSGSIARVLRYGYKSGDRIIRPAQVIINS